MPRYLKGKLTFVGISIEESVTTNGLLTVKFEDRHGETYSWAPKWIDLVAMIEEAKIVEKLNNKGKQGRGSWIIDYQIK